MDVPLELENVGRDDLYNNEKLAALVNKYGNVPSDQRLDFRDDGFRIRFRLSRAYRGLEKQEVIVSRPRVGQVFAVKQRKQQRMAALMKEIEEEMRQPLPEELAKQRLREKHLKEHSKHLLEGRSRADQLNRRALEERKVVDTSTRAISPRRAQYLKDYWGKPSAKKTAEKGDWRLRGQNPGETGEQWWLKFTQKQPKKTPPRRASMGALLQSRRKSACEVKVAKQRGRRESMPAKVEELSSNAIDVNNMDFLTAPTDHGSNRCSNVQRRHTIVTLMEPVVENNYESQGGPVANEANNDTEESTADDRDQPKVPVEEGIAENPEEPLQEHEHLSASLLDRRGSTGSVLSKHSYFSSYGELALSHRSRTSSCSGSASSASSSSASSESNSECSEGDINEFLDNYKVGGNLRSGLSILLGAKSIYAGSRAGSVKSAVRSVSFKEPACSGPLPKLTETCDESASRHNTLRVSFNGKEKDAVEPAGYPSERALSARDRLEPASTNSNNPNDDPKKPLKTCRYLYSMCNCQQVGRKETLVKMQRKRRKSVGVITVFGCPEPEEQESKPSVCPFCSVFPNRRIHAWLAGVQAATQ